MSLTVETGTGLDDADSYVTVAEARAWADLRGLTLPADDTTVEQLLRKASDFIETHRTRFRGIKTSATQALQWPRKGATIDGSDLAEDEIPNVLKQAQIRLAVDAVDTDLQPTGEGREVASETVGPLSTSYVKQGTGTVRPQFNAAMALLEPLFNGGGTFTLRTVRV
jgi:hypothetical protein